MTLTIALPPAHAIPELTVPTGVFHGPLRATIIQRQQQQRRNTLYPKRPHPYPGARTGHPPITLPNSSTKPLNGPSSVSHHRHHSHSNDATKTNYTTSIPDFSHPKSSLLATPATLINPKNPTTNTATHPTASKWTLPWACLCCVRSISTRCADLRHDVEFNKTRVLMKFVIRKESGIGRKSAAKTTMATDARRHRHIGPVFVGTTAQSLSFADVIFVTASSFY